MTPFLAILSQTITEISGEFRCGKTQLAHTLCVTAQVPTFLHVHLRIVTFVSAPRQLPPDHGGANGKVIFIDTEGTFRPERIESICERFNVESAAVLGAFSSSSFVLDASCGTPTLTNLSTSFSLFSSSADNILYARALTHEMQLDLLEQASAMIVSDTSPFRLVVVDSITALFRTEFTGRGELAERQQKLGQFLSRLQKLADEFNLAVFVTNQVVSDPGAQCMFVSDPKKAIGGNIVGHACSIRLQVRKGKGDQRICKVYDHPEMPEADCVYEIQAGGICDTTE